MPVAVMVDNPQGSQEFYEKVRAHLGQEGPAGGHAHIAGPGPNGGWRVIEIWDSLEDAMRFREERLKPAWEAVGGAQGPPPEPQVWDVHTLLK